MKRWGYILGGLIVWTVHFLGVYVIASIADVVADDGHPLSRAAVGVFTLACLIVAGGLTVVAARRWRRGGGEMGFENAIAATGGAISAISILWQGLPAVVG
ncbi:hypothetical protein IWC96_03065 [Brevundimonas sp. BAL450]|uniref:Uncharacterized protein n=1 Tax=Brevundimonas abyssalis TAR-001 TaxID=1391729 RepID=A0A8E0KK19_9CAUL|nr:MULTISPECIES: hypothetical protein [Brevundimonas]MBG7614263.1 hypothetical protein [Brevundimonas sp. BAL450]GAD58700.1 hypothetical protein MBEBAB_0950 [Brevundimonas abyssalis TAR-001]